MAMVHWLPPNLSTFGDFADALLHDSGDCNHDGLNLIKVREREQRSEASATKFSNIQARLKVQQWKTFLAVSDATYDIHNRKLDGTWQHEKTWEQNIRLMHF